MTKSAHFRAWYEFRAEYEADDAAKNAALAVRRNANAKGFAARARAAKARA